MENEDQNKDEQSMSDAMATDSDATMTDNERKNTMKSNEFSLGEGSDVPQETPNITGDESEASEQVQSNRLDSSLTSDVNSRKHPDAATLAVQH